jgi:hypothetical protein
MKNFSEFIYENYLPETESVGRWVEKITKDFPVKEENILDKNVKYVMVDDKICYITGPFANKSRLINKIVLHYEYYLEESNIHIPSIRKAIKIWFENELNK